TGREEEWGEGTMVPAETRKKVAVIGAGPAGMEAARVMALRGHTVYLYEREKELGGQLRLAHRLPSREVIKSTIRWYENQLKKANVKLALGSAVEAKTMHDLKPDAIVVATGSTYVRNGFSGFIPEPIPGSDQNHV